MSVESVMPSNHLILCRPVLLPPSIFPSITVFSNESVLHIRLPKYWSFSFSTSPPNEYSGLISFRIDWLDLLSDQGTFKGLQHHRPKTSFLRCSAFFMVQLSHPYMTTRKTIDLPRQTFPGGTTRPHSVNTLVSTCACNDAGRPPGGPRALPWSHCRDRTGCRSGIQTGRPTSVT